VCEQLPQVYSLPETLHKHLQGYRLAMEHVFLQAAWDASRVSARLSALQITAWSCKQLDMQPHLP
jgi:hypothetical protein